MHDMVLLAIIWTGVFISYMAAEKTKLTHINAGFDFLGKHLRKYRGKLIITPSKKNVQAICAKIRRTVKDCHGHSAAELIQRLNPILRGWFVYFKHADKRTFRSIDGFVRRRLRAILRHHNKRPGRGKSLNDHRTWPNAFFAEQGLFTMHEAWLLASQSR